MCDQKYLVASSSDLKSTKAKPLQIGSLVFLFPETAGLMLVIPGTPSNADFRSLWMFFFLGRLTNRTRKGLGITSDAVNVASNQTKVGKEKPNVMKLFALK